jgi:glycolate oxidase
LTENEIAAELALILTPDQVIADAGVRRAYDCDAYTVDKSAPAVVVLPETTEQVQAVVRWCISRQVPYTPRGAGTGLSGGALPALGGVVISTKRFNRILETDIENRCLKAQAGIANKRITDAVVAQGLHFAPDPSSQSVSTLGGNIAENSGGPHTLKYGVTVQHILGVTMVDTEGEIVEIGGKVAGGPGYDLLGLIVGSEGTLGIVTEAWVKLTPLPKAVETLLVAFEEIRGATQTVADIIASGTIPAALEIMDEGILVALKAAFNLKYHPDAKALLLVEVDGEPENVRQEKAAVEGICKRNGVLEVHVAKDEAERLELWKARKKGIGAMGRLAPTIVTHDGVIPRSKLPEMLDTVYNVAAKHKLGVANLFHAGDGNLHPCFYFDDREPGVVDRVVEAGEDIIRRCIELGGSITGEHGVGVEKQDLMPLMFSAENLALQAKLKAAFTEGGLCNPCKVLPNQKSCVEHKMRWRGPAW